ncbi:cryptochrome/photolyase family protein [Myroides sp. LJL119]
MKEKVSIFWFRRDLRLEDNFGLCQALACGVAVLPIFIFDPHILQQLEDKSDRRVDYIHQSLQFLNKELEKYGSTLITLYGDPVAEFDKLIKDYAIAGVYCNEDYEPYAIKRDHKVSQFLNQTGISFNSYKDQVIFEKQQVVKSDGSPYTVYTPYSRKWRELLTPKNYQGYQGDFSGFFKTKNKPIMDLKQLGFEKTDMVFTQPTLDLQIIQDYEKYRDYPYVSGTTHLGTALRFGTISIRKCVEFGLKHNQTWLSELIWREFFMQILYHFPKVVTQSFKPKYDLIAYRNNYEDFVLWTQGKTGYPIVDAGMRELNQTGYMHNRVRMIVASFLCKHLLIDWRWGEAYFAQKLNDYDLSANNGNWQWAAGCGCDAAPYFRVFNPTLQNQKFDKDNLYVKKWVPELGTASYPEPMVEHSFARQRALDTYGKVLKDNSLNK